MNKNILNYIALNLNYTLHDYNTYRAGATDYINAVWHNADEIPEYGKFVLVNTLYHGAQILGSRMNEADYKEMRLEFTFTKWAYVEDLLPNKE